MRQASFVISMAVLLLTLLVIRLDGTSPPAAPPDDDGHRLRLDGVASSSPPYDGPRRVPAWTTPPALPAYVPQPGLARARDYSDPTAGGIVPLIMVEGLQDEFLSRHFRVADFIARDGAAYARISPALVNTLEHIRWLSESTIYVSSGYRHPALNAAPAVGGAARSQHLAGLAVDIWSDTRTPGELAALALDVTECDIGIGLGRTFVHLDLRGHLASWVAAGAAMDEATFDAWVRARCAALRSNAEGALPSFSETAAERTRQAATQAEDSLIAAYRGVMVAFAAIQSHDRGPGAVILDLRQDSLMQRAGLPYRLSYALSGTEEAQAWALEPLLRSIQPNGNFAFAILRPDGAPLSGAMGLSASP